MSTPKQESILSSLSYGKEERERKARWMGDIFSRKFFKYYHLLSPLVAIPQESFGTSEPNI